MREIKFRAWNREEGWMGRVTDIQIDHGVYVRSPDRETPYLLLCDLELMQFTGLLDKADREIYEGDIIHDPLTGKRYPVVFENGAFRANGLVVCNAFPNDVVIGNIYENPELLNN